MSVRFKRQLDSSWGPFIVCPHVVEFVFGPSMGATCFSILFYQSARAGRARNRLCYDSSLQVEEASLGHFVLFYPSGLMSLLLCSCCQIVESDRLVDWEEVIEAPNGRRFETGNFGNHQTRAYRKRTKKDLSLYGFFFLSASAYFDILLFFFVRFYRPYLLRLSAL